MKTMVMKNNSEECPICGEKAIDGLLGLPRFYTCETCIFGWKKTAEKVVYAQDYYQGKSTIARNLFTPIEKIFYALRRKYVGDSEKNVWIDIGAGEGGFIKTVKAKVRIGVEISLSGRKMMEEGGLNTLSNIEFLKKKGLQADVISFWHVLEHVENPVDYLEAAKRNLKKNGLIVIGVPNLDSFEAMFFKKYWFHLQPQFHLWHFSTNAVKKLLNNSGFRVEYIDYWSLEHHPTGVLQSFINKSSDSIENVLHKIIKRGTGNKQAAKKDISWSLFWLTIGLPVVVLFWVSGVVFHKSGTIVVVATSNSH